MTTNPSTIYIGNSLRRPAASAAQGEYVNLLGEPFYKIQDFDAIEPFFISLASSFDHWLFIASTGGLTAGRVNAENALFPYYTVDKITENSENTGHKAIFLVEQAQRTSLWEPFSERQQGVYQVRRNLYKNVAGTVLVFEEINLDLELTYRYAWRTGNRFGFIKTSWLINDGSSDCRVELLDGLQNILPANITSQTQVTFSPLLDAYKRSELHSETGLAIFALNSTLTDLAEPSESLLATTVFQLGLDQADILLSSAQLGRFRSGDGVMTEGEVRGQRGAYFVHAALDLAPGAESNWHVLADVNQDSAAIVEKITQLAGDRVALRDAVEGDLAANTAALHKIVAQADGLQLSQDALCTAHHFANVMFNVMRGGIFTDQYWINAADFADFVRVHSPKILQQQAAFFADLPEKIHLNEMHARAEAAASSELIRLSYSYLPLTFSRRHGDPSRPWNRFAINIKKADGSLRLDYEGNWRDIFQNWEALALSYPEFVESMICTFLNATTVDGYNPYRITYHGIDWELPEPGNPWANIGYWSDHQIIYLLKLMEISARAHPGKLRSFLARPLFSYAHVPYQIKPYADVLKDPYNTIVFNWELEKQIEARLGECGADGKLLVGADGRVVQVSLAEKLLTLLLAKLVNFVPGGGIWMNTQRPEWNDANNALVGKGLSVVTLGYLRRYIDFCVALFNQSALAAVPLSAEVYRFYQRVAGILESFRELLLDCSITDEQRRAMMDALGRAGSDYRWDFYRNSLSGQVHELPISELVAFLTLAQYSIEHTLRANRRSDHLYHAYNVLHLGEGTASVAHLYEMLEGQAAILSSGMLSDDDALALLASLRSSALYQPEQNSYILYPDRVVPGFLHKNRLSPAQVEQVELFTLLAESGDRSLVVKDVQGVYHFSGHLRNVRDVSKALDALAARPEYAALVEAEAEKIKAVFEEVFRHAEFTGRSGAFFAYEGLGSIYWHMVSKLLLAVQETALNASSAASFNALRQRYADIRAGLSFHKPVQVYGAFPTDPYSHTPKGQGAKQPGMTGLVKEEILTRLAELGVSIEEGSLAFRMRLLDRGELLPAPAVFAYLDVEGHHQQLELPAGSLAYTICQTPVILEESNETWINVVFSDGRRQCIKGSLLDAANSQHIFRRDGFVRRLDVHFLPEK